MAFNYTRIIAKDRPHLQVLKGLLAKDLSDVVKVIDDGWVPNSLDVQSTRTYDPDDKFFRKNRIFTRQQKKDLLGLGYTLEENTVTGSGSKTKIARPKMQ